MDDCDRLPGIIVRMGVGIAWRAVCCPSGMSDSDRTRHRRSAVCQLLEHLEPSCGFLDLNLFPVKHCHSRRVVSSVLQLRKPLQNHRRRLMFSNIPHNSAHSYILQYILFVPIASACTAPPHQRHRQASVVFSQLVSYEFTAA